MAADEAVFRAQAGKRVHHLTLVMGVKMGPPEDREVPEGSVTRYSLLHGRSTVRIFPLNQSVCV